jgi:hypothetical protein
VRCTTRKRRKQLQKEKPKKGKKNRWQNGGGTLMKEQDNGKLFKFLSFWCGQKKLRYQKKGCYVNAPQNQEILTPT